MNTVTFDNWWAQPIHCPFCGEVLYPDQTESCKHLLYILSAGNFVMRSARFDAELGQEAGECWPEFSQGERERIGRPETVARDVLLLLPNGIEFDITTPTDGALIGFAAYQEELCAFGKDHQSPYDEASTPCT
jgi:hypothetical protein